MLAVKAGVPNAIVEARHRLQIRVYYEDTDFSGRVYHASYLRFLERGRTEFLRELGIEHRTSFGGNGGRGFYFVVRSMSVDFLKPALMDDELMILTGISSLAGASVGMVQEIQRGYDTLVTAGVRVAVIVNGKARRIPPEVVAKLMAASASAMSMARPNPRSTS